MQFKAIEGFHHNIENVSDILIQRGKLLIRHLMDIYMNKPEGDEGKEQFADILFSIVVSKAAFNSVENLSDFINLVQQSFLNVIDVDKKKNVEIMFLESFEE